MRAPHVVPSDSRSSGNNINTRLHRLHTSETTHPVFVARPGRHVPARHVVAAKRRRAAEHCTSGPAGRHVPARHRTPRGVMSTLSPQTLSARVLLLLLHRVRRHPLPSPRRAGDSVPVLRDIPSKEVSRLNTIQYNGDVAQQDPVHTIVFVSVMPAALIPNASMEWLKLNNRPMICPSVSWP